MYLSKLFTVVFCFKKNAILVSQLRAVQYPVEGFGTEHDQLEGLLIRISSRLEKSERSVSFAHTYYDQLNVVIAEHLLLTGTP